MVDRRTEIKSSLDQRAMGICWGNPNFENVTQKPAKKYERTSCLVDHGQHRPKPVDPTKLVTRRRGELFGRIEPANLARFIDAGHEREVQIPTLDEAEILRQGKFASKLPSIENPNPKFITLDLRSAEDYRKGHVFRSVHYPANHIQNDRLFAPMHRYRNKPDVLIVLYMDDERHGVQATKLIFEKGFDNVYLMSGQYAAFAKLRPDMIETGINGHKVGDSESETHMRI